MGTAGRIEGSGALEDNAVPDDSAGGSAVLCPPCPLILALRRRCGLDVGVGSSTGGGTIFCRELLSGAEDAMSGVLDSPARLNTPPGPESAARILDVAPEPERGIGMPEA